MAMTRAAAEALALDAAAWLAERPDELAGFLIASGAKPADLRARLLEPVFLGFLLDHLLADETRARGVAEHLGLATDRLLAARAALPGGDAPHWT
ncbi:MAG: DUF3572 family protein [Pikeienuella sp.]